MARFIPNAEIHEPVPWVDKSAAAWSKKLSFVIRAQRKPRQSQAVWKREAPAIRSFLWGQARPALRPDAPTRLIARRML
jgi:hypothetical protein